MPPAFADSFLIQDRKEMFEAARLQQRVRHPNVLRVLGLQEYGDEPCILLELAEGGDVTDWQTRETTKHRQWKVMVDVAKGLQALHTANPKIVHRDIKACFSAYGWSVKRRGGGRWGWRTFDCGARMGSYSQ